MRIKIVLILVFERFGIVVEKLLKGSSWDANVTFTFCDWGNLGFANHSACKAFPSEGTAVLSTVASSCGSWVVVQFGYCRDCMIVWLCDWVHILRAVGHLRGAVAFIVFFQCFVQFMTLWKVFSSQLEDTLPTLVLTHLLKGMRGSWTRHFWYEFSFCLYITARVMDLFCLQFMVGCILNCTFPNHLPGHY